MSYYDDASLVLIPSGVKASKVYSQKPTNGSGDFTFARASTATRTNSAGLIESVASNVPRLDYSGGATCPRLLLEPQRTNLVLRSEEFDNAAWTKIATTVSANTTTSPDGTLSADTVLADGASGFHVAQTSSISYTSGTAASFTVFAKKGTNNFMQLIAPAAVGGMFANFNLDTGVVGTLGTISGTTPTSSIQDYGNGWYRCALNFTPNATIASVTSIAIVTSASAARAESNTLATSIFLWGAQIEAGAFATSYIPTTTAAVTRLADACSKTGISSLIGQTEGTLFLDFIFKTPSVGTHGQIGISNPTSPHDRLIIWNNITLNTLAATLQLNGLTIFNTSLGTFVDGQRYKIALAYESGSNAAYVNGTQAFTNSTTFTFSSTITDFILGAYSLTAMPPHQLTNQAALFPTRLTNSQLAELTTL